MCGILGIVNRAGIDEMLMLKMRDAMVHRGPDDAGIWMNASRTVGLAHRRLSIIDLSLLGHQPMPSYDETLWISFNGEIYNYLEIRRELLAKGYRFRSNTDTEVIICAYKEWGSGCLHKFNGMFSFGIYDAVRKTIFLARDRVGKKPLYYHVSSGRFVFASELKALILDSTISSELDMEALNHYMAFGYIGGELCIFKAVRKLPPAHAMLYNTETFESKVWSYWDTPEYEERSLSVDELVNSLEHILTDAVRLRMISDVPLGAFLSGGVDSSLIVALMSTVSDKPVKTFSVGFDEGRFNELPYARIVANHFGTDHHEIMVRPDAFAVLPDLVRQYDEPFADSSMIPTYYVSKATREYVTVALSGDGGDEVFGGYSSYVASVGSQYISQVVPSPLRRTISAIARKLPDTVSGKRHLLRFEYDPYDAFIDRCMNPYFNLNRRSQLFSNDVLARLNHLLDSPERERRESLQRSQYDFVNRLTYADFKTFLPDDILFKVDRASMYVSLEVRAPLLDYRLAEFSFRYIAGDKKVRHLSTKYLLKQLAKKYLPMNLDVNRKWGFSIPVADWFRGSLQDTLRHILMKNPDRYFKSRYIERLLSEHGEGVDHSGRLFAILVFSLWEQHFLKRES